jgi:hypothetical protein
MSRHISFFLTQRQFRERTKTVTRRLGWKTVKPGDILVAVEKGQGLKKGEKVVILGRIRVTDAEQERLDRMTWLPRYGEDECRREGFPDMTPAEFVEMFCHHNKCEPSGSVTRIAFEYLDEGPKP